MFGLKPVKRAKSFNTKTPNFLELPESSHLCRSPPPISPNKNVGPSLKHSQSDRKMARPDIRVRIDFRKHNLEKRKSRSLDEVALKFSARDNQQVSRVIDLKEKSASDLQIHRAVLQELRDKQLHKSQVEYASLEKINEEKGKTSFYGTRPFPIENSVEIRYSSETVRRNSYRSQTIHFAPRSIEQQQQVEYIEREFDVKGVTKICCDGTSRKLNKSEYLKICYNRIMLIHDKGGEEVIMERLNQIKCTPLSKKEIEIRTMDEDVCKVCKIQFDSAKDKNIAKLDLDTCYMDNRQLENKQEVQVTSQIKDKLRRLLGKRSSKDDLEKKGIIRNEPIFGNTLNHLYEMYKQELPEFVIRILQIIEMPKNIVSDGIYRASGNLATIQKVRFQIDKNNLKILDEFKNDIDVLTGSLKLFFRELQEPLISHKIYLQLFHHIHCLQEADVNPQSEEQIKKIVNKMGKAHSSTLMKLLEHLIKVESHSDMNRMDAYNLSTVWGPTLIWPPDDCLENLLESHKNANKVIELLLHVYRKALKGPQRNESSPKISYKRENVVEAAQENSINNTKTLMLELSENLGLKRAGSRDNLMKSMENLSKFRDDPPLTPKTPDKMPKHNLQILCANSQKIPEFVMKVVPLIEKRINSELLYKRSGSNEKLEKIRKKISKNRNNLNSMEKYNINDLAWALKNFFYDLSEPLIPKSVFERLLLATDERIAVTKLRNVKKELGNAQIPFRETLDYLFNHLVKVSWNEDRNKMSQHNIATEWTPFLCHSFIENDKFSKESCIHVLETLLQIYDSRTPAINMNVNNGFYHNGEYRVKVFDVGNHSTSSEILLGSSPDKYAVTKRKPKITKNESSLYRDSRFIPHTFSLYDNVHPYADHIKDEATILDGHAAKSILRKNMEDSTKL